MVYRKKPNGPNKRLLEIVAQLEEEDSEKGDWGKARWTKCYRSLQEHDDVIVSPDTLQGLKFWGAASVKKVWSRFQRGDADDDEDDDGPGPSRRKKKSPAKSKGKGKAKNAVPDFNFEGEDFSDVFGRAPPPPQPRTASQSSAASSQTLHSSQQSASSASQPPNVDDLRGFVFSYIDDQNNHVPTSDGAFISFPNVLFKIKFPSSDIVKPWPRTYVQDVKSLGGGFSVGFVSQDVAESVQRSPGLPTPPSTSAPKHVAPVPLSQRTSTSGAPSSAALQAEMARMHKKLTKTNDPTRQSLAVLNALQGAGITMAGPSSSRAPPPVARSATTPSIPPPVPRPPPIAPTPAPPPPLTRTQTLPTFAHPPPPSFPTQRPPRPPPLGPGARSAPRLSAHIPAPNPVDNMQRVIESQSQSQSQDDSDPVLSSTQTDIFAPFEPIVLPRGTFDVRLVLDVRERNNKNTNADLLDELQRRGIPVEQRALSVGDVAWIAVRRAAVSDAQVNECVLDYIVERKRTDDLVSSIKDGRFHEQKFRLKESGLGQVYYLIEHHNTEQYRGTASTAKMIDTALSSTQIVDGFKVKEVHKGGTKEVANWLASMHKVLTRKHLDQDLLVIPPALIRRHNYSALQHHLRHVARPDVVHLTTYACFQSLNAKSGHISLRECWSRMLLCVHGLSNEKVASIVGTYDTPRALWESFKEAREVEREQRAALPPPDPSKKRQKRHHIEEARYMLCRLPDAVGRKRIGEAVSERVWELFMLEWYEG